MQTKTKKIFEQLCGYLEMGMDCGFYTDEECEDIDALMKQFYEGEHLSTVDDIIEYKED